MDWIERSKIVFAVERPQHFTDYLHCEECREHDETLRNSSPNSIGLDELGNPGWDPLCFCFEHGIKYFFPALIRLVLESIDDDFYFDQFLFHLGYEGENNRFMKSCSTEQKRFVTEFLEYVLNTYPKEIDFNLSADEAINVYQLWHGK